MDNKQSESKAGKKANRIIIVVLVAAIAVVAGVLVWGIKNQEPRDIEADNGAYEMGDMVVAVKITDSAESLADTGSYRYGYTTQPSKKHAERMIVEVNNVVGREVNLVEYETPEALGQALVNGNVEAAIYNEESTEDIEAVQEDYSVQTKILYRYGQSLTEEEESALSKEPFHVFISGIDTEGELEKTSRSDVNIVATINPETKQILLTTTPRDYYVVIPGVSGKQKDKLTHAGIYGVDASIAALENLYDIEIDYYVRLNFTSMLDVIDDIGGIEVYSDYEFVSRHGNFQFYKGTNYMNGEQALGYVRERYAFEDGDNQRGKNQEAVLTAIIEKMMTPAALENATELIAKLYGKVETNFTTAQISDLVVMQQKTQSSWNTVSVHAVGTGDKQACYSMGSQSLYVMQPNNDSINEIKEGMQKVLDGEEISE